MGKLIENEGGARPQDGYTMDVPKNAGEGAAPLRDGAHDNGLVQITEKTWKVEQGSSPGGPNMGSYRCLRAGCGREFELPRPPG